MAPGKVGTKVLVSVYLLYAAFQNNRSSVIQAGSEPPPQQEAAEQPRSSRERFHRPPPPSPLSARSCASHRTPPGRLLASPAPFVQCSRYDPGLKAILCPQQQSQDARTDALGPEIRSRDRWSVGVEVHWWNFLAKAPPQVSFPLKPFFW